MTETSDASTLYECRGSAARECIANYSGPVQIESYTVMYGVEEAQVGHFACLTPAGQRTWMNTTDTDLMQSMTEEEFCGRSAKISNAEIRVG